MMRVAAPMLLAAGLAFTSPAYAAAEQEAASLPAAEAEVLTLTEAAALLRVPAADVAAMAQRGELPARRLGREWRFNRQALLVWLGAGWAPIEGPPEEESRAGVAEPSVEPLPTTATPSLPVPPEPPVQLAQIRGRSGEAAPAGETAPAEAPPSETSEGGSTAPAQPIGEKPELTTAQEVALRDISVLLGRGQATVELDLSYTDSRQDVIVPVNFFNETNGELKNKTFAAALSARYGLLPDTQVSAGLPLYYEHAKIEVNGSQETRRTRWETGNVNLGVRHTAVREGFNIPEVILSVDGGIPTNDGSFSAGGGISLAKTVDPAVLFGSFAYRYNFSNNSDDVSRLSARNVFSASLGYAFAINDTLSLTTAVSGVFNDETNFKNYTIKSDQQYDLQLALTSLLGEGLYIEPSVTFGLNNPGSLFIFGVRIPYTFTP
jgi:excisionase family DNA binding protein